MSSMAMAIFINPLPTNLNKTPFSCTSCRISKQPEIFYKKSIRLDNRMLARATENGIFSTGDDQRTGPEAANAFKRDTLINNDDGVSLHQNAAEIHLFFNRVSKWLVIVVISGLIFLRRDPFAIWVVNGIILNHLLSTTLKLILKQERPVSQVRSDPGMPSSHAQNIFCALVFVVQSVIEWQGLNDVTDVVSMFVVMLGSYFSKWLVGVTIVGTIVLRRDALGLWCATGSVLNYMLAMVLKQIVKQERPLPEAKSGPGMPSSHGQSIFYVLVFVILSVFQWQGLNGVTALFSVLVVGLASYFSWLRVFFHYHTTSQVIVGALTGSLFSGLWFWSWGAIVHKAYSSNMWVRIIVAIGAAAFILELVTKGYQAFALANRYRFSSKEDSRGRL